MSLAINKSTLLLTLAIITSQVIDCEQQYFKIWYSQGCTNVEDDLQTDTSVVTTDGRSKIYFRAFGLWTVEACDDDLNCTDRTIRSGTSNISCTSFTIPTGTTQLQLTQFGDINQTAKQIHFFTEINFQGEEIIVYDCEGQRFLDKPARSFFFTGPYEWELDDDDEFGYRCLNYTSSFVGANGYGFTFILGINIKSQLVNPLCDGPTTTTTADPSASTVDPSASTVDPSASTVDPSASTVDPSASTADPSASTVDPSASTVDPSASTVDPSASTADPSVSTAVPSLSTLDPSASTVDPSTSTADPSVSTADPSASTMDPSASTADPSLSTEDPSAPTENPTGATDATTNPTGPTVDPTESTSTVVPTESTFTPSVTTVASTEAIALLS